MPHCIIEITENLIKDFDETKLMKDIAAAIFDLGSFNANDIKVRIYPIKFSFLGIQEQEHSYVTATIQVMDNKTDEQLNIISDNVQSVLLNHFKNPVGKLSITTQISFLNRKFYKRHKNF